MKCGLPWRNWMMPRDYWEGGVLRETQSRVGDSVPYTSPHSQSTPIMDKTGFMAIVNTTI